MWTSLYCAKTETATEKLQQTLFPLFDMKLMLLLYLSRALNAGLFHVIEYVGVNVLILLLKYRAVAITQN